MLRSAASPGSVGFGRPEGGVSGLLKGAASGRPPFLETYYLPRRTFAKTQRAPAGAPTTSHWLSPSLDLGLAELDVLLGNRVVFLLGKLVGHRARVLLGDVIEPGIGARNQLDLDGRGFRHGKPR